ncbi:MAG: fumarate hydratase [Candidatus Aminicenantes bacterium]|nr:fumarate hydratase [Candidatus Aminicenantes bacterium]
MAEFLYSPMFSLGPDSAGYRLLTKDHVSRGSFEGRDIVKIAPEGLALLAEQAFTDVAFLLRPSHLKQLREILDDPESSANDKYVATELLRNAVISAERVLPMCQDTGTAIINAKKGQAVWTGGGDDEALSRGVFNAYTKNYFRYSQNAALTMYDEKNTSSNLPAQIDITAADGDEYKFLFIAKGGGSANKSYLFQETKAVLNPESLLAFLINKIKNIGTAACPPYHLAVVVGGTSAEMVLKTVKLASARYLDNLPTKGDLSGHAFRDLELEVKLLEATRKLGLGAGFGGKYFALDVRVIRLPRHGASCPIGLGVSCNADRNVTAKITRDGIYLEKLETEPAKYLPRDLKPSGTVVPIDLNRPMAEIRAALSKYPVATILSLNGPIIVGRDIAHAKLKERLDRGEDLPQYLKDHIIYYAGPAKTPPGYASGSFGPTTAGRMDDYVPLFQARSGSLVMLAKGNRSKGVTESCKKYGGFYLGSIGGPAARLAKDCITKQEVLEYPELGMEAIFKITVKDFPAFILVDDKGNDFYAGILKGALL